MPPVGDFARVAGSSREVTIGGASYRVVSLDDLLAVKEHVGRPKDKLVAIELRAIRERQG